MLNAQIYFIFTKTILMQCRVKLDVLFFGSCDFLFVGYKTKVLGTGKLPENLPNWGEESSQKIQKTSKLSSHSTSRAQKLRGYLQIKIICVIQKENEVMMSLFLCQASSRILVTRQPFLCQCNPPHTHIFGNVQPKNIMCTHFW